MRVAAMAFVYKLPLLALRSARQILSQRYFGCTSPVAAQRVAVVLSGCGVYDGSEVHEASACWVHLSRAGAEVTFYAPDVEQMHVVDHCTGVPVETEKRNVLRESARIARGMISPLSKLSESSYDALVFPGGFGVAKNLSTFALDGAGMTVNPEIQQAISNFHTSKKPIGLCCISPILAAKLLPGCSVTVGHDTEEDGKWPYAGTAATVQTMGAKHIVKDVNEAVVDKENLIVTTPAFMCNAKVHEVYDSVGAMITALVGLLSKP